MEHRRINTIGHAPRNAASRRNTVGHMSDVSSQPQAVNEHARMLYDVPMAPEGYSGSSADVLPSHGVKYRTHGLDEPRDDRTLAEHLSALYYSTNG